MNEQIPEQLPEHHTYHLSRNRFVILIIGTVAVSLLLVIIAMALYASSGAAQVDLSRPGYKSVRNQAKEEDPSFSGFVGTGLIDKKSLEQFNQLFTKQEANVNSTKGFESNVLDDAALQIQAK